ncbi:MAG TPA: DNA polymerase III subunit delta' [Pseudomonadales bacterium]|nr:DNA polymerase III subunit delta' [Pseudomonadales bacterium]
MMQLLEWHQSQWQQIMDGVSQSRLPHAMLLAGPEGVGKNAFAKLLATRLLFLQPVDSLPCGQCKSCLLIQAGTHPDWVQLGREDDSKFIKVDQIRELVDFAAKTAQMNGFKVASILEADTMNIASANALLKTLEEPSADTVILLISSRSSSLSATVRSRCQTIRFPIPTSAQSLKWLQTQTDQPLDALEALLGVAGGAPFKALDLMQRNWLMVRRDWLRNLAQVRIGKDDPLPIADKAVAAFKEDLSRALREWLSWTQSWMVALAAPAQADEDARDSLAIMRARVDANLLSQWHDKLLETIKQLVSNPNPQLLFESLLLFWAQSK